MARAAPVNKGMQLRLDGMGEMIAAMDELGKGVEQRVMGSAVTKAIKHLTKAARRRVPTRTGLLKLSMGNLTRKYKKRGSAIVVAVGGPRVKFSGKKADEIRQGMNRKPYKYAHLVHGGTEAHTVEAGRRAGSSSSSKALGTPTGMFSVVDVAGARKQPFLLQAWTATKGRMESTLHREIWAGIKKEVAKAKAKKSKATTRMIGAQAGRLAAGKWISL